ncbi:dr1-associated corepressor [Lutzomyia longipalpis]|uniref:dr1-associated corepressor n=1 Tax=Lutzomyia longipalpis TaxID=7200 RepID=UPI002483F619|nr:dr1-associated corepressor [Lutzomyia longipalpis]
MPSKKKKYNARFPPGRIKKIMQTDEEVGKVAQAVPIIIPRTLELFVESLLTKTVRITNARHAKTLSPSHMKQCIMSESRFDFLKELVKNVPDISVAEEIDNSPPAPPEDDVTNGARNGRLGKGGESWLRNYGRPASMDLSQTRNYSNDGKCLTPNVMYPGGTEGNTVIRYTPSRTWGQKTQLTGDLHGPSRPSKVPRMDSTQGCHSAPPQSGDSSIFSFDIRQKPQREYPSPLATSTVTSTTNNLCESVASTTPPVLKFDISSTPVVKIDYSHLPLNVAPAQLPAAPAASELDEDYDNI